MVDLIRNLAKLDGHLARFRDAGVLNHIAGRAQPARATETFQTL